MLERARRLRRTQTDAEWRLWQTLRARDFAGYKFKRQQPLGVYIVDFVCFERRLIVEVDGSQHVESASDRERDQWLANQGFRVLRFWNNAVLQESESVQETILAALAEHASPSP
jgi:very-short-patch-repair endonuclease